MCPPKKNQIKDSYNQLGGKMYDNRYAEEQIEKYKHISDHLGWGISLDNGCGTGLFLEKMGKFSVGLDFSSELLRGARLRLGKHQNLVNGDSENLPFRSHVFDTTVSVTVSKTGGIVTSSVEASWTTMFSVTVSNSAGIVTYSTPAG